MAATDAELLKKNNVTHVLSLGVFPDRLHPGVKHMCVDIVDIPSAKIGPHLDPAVEFIKEALAGRGAILVHCYAGVSRSSSCVIAYLMREKNMCYFNALYFVRSKRNVVHPNLGFAKELQAYEKRIEKELGHKLGQSKEPDSQ